MLFVLKLSKQEFSTENIELSQDQITRFPEKQV